MSEATPDTREAVEFPHQGEVAFSALLDALAPEAEGAGTAVAAGGTDGASGTPAVQPAAGAGPGAGGDSAPPAAGGDAAPGPGAGEAGRADAGTGQPDGGQPQAGGGEPEGAAGGGAEQSAATGEGATPAGWTVEPSTVTPKLAELSTKLEENITKAHQQQAYTAVKEEHGRYFEALEKHPRLLVGQQVPAIGKEGTETLRSSEDAREWQEAVKSILVQEINARAETSMQESRTFLETMHASIDLFKNNADLIPGTKGFNRDLADRFAALAKPYEIRVDGKLNGYSIPVQPLIDNLRAQLKPATKAAPPAEATATNPPADPPQAGLTSKAGSISEKEDFSTLFGTIGLPHLKI